MGPKPLKSYFAVVFVITTTGVTRAEVVKKAESPDDFRDKIKSQYPEGSVVYFGPVTVISVLRGKK